MKAQMARLREKYQQDVVPALRKEFGYTTVMAVPRITKVVVNMGLGEATQNAKVVDTGADELGKITGQKAAVRRAKKSIAQFKVRQGMPIGAMVTLRGDRMYEFLDRLMSIALPRVRDFRGVSGKGFDGRGNYTLGLRDQLMFTEIDYLKVDKARGMNVCVVTTARTDAEARKLLQLLGIFAMVTSSALAMHLSLIWCAHIGFDRALGYGLKYDAGFSFTHLGRIGRRARTAVE